MEGSSVAFAPRSTRSSPSATTNVPVGLVGSTTKSGSTPRRTSSARSRRPPASSPIDPIAVAFAPRDAAQAAVFAAVPPGARRAMASCPRPATTTSTIRSPTATKRTCSAVTPRSAAVRPGPLPGDAVDRDPRDETGRRVGHGREDRAGADVHLGQPMEQLRGAALADARPAVEDGVVPHADLVRPWRFERERHGRVTADVADLSVLEQVARDDLVSLEPDPDDRHLRAAVGVQRHEMRERAGLDQRA